MIKFESSLKFWNLFRCLKYNWDFSQKYPFYFKDAGLITFCGAQGSGKTLSAVQYCLSRIDSNPLLMIVSNVALRSYPFNARIEGDNLVFYGSFDYACPIAYAQDIATMLYFFGNGERLVIEYDGLDCLKLLENGYEGVLYLIDELQLEFNSLESKNIGIDQMIEFCQQRKQRKSIVGTTQVFMRLAKPVREQIYDVVDCRGILKYFQLNKYFDGQQAYEEDGKLVTPNSRSYFFFHSPEMYQEYDTYKKMQRYKKEWKGRAYRNEN